MGIEAKERHAATPGTTGDTSHPLDGIWNKATPNNSTDTTPITDSTVSQPTDSRPNLTTPKGAGPGDLAASPLANEQSPPVFTDSNGTPISESKLAGLKYTGGFGDKTGIEVASMSLPKFPALEKQDVSKVSDKGHPTEKQHPTAVDLSAAAHRAIGSGEYGNKVPSTAAEFKNDAVPQNLKCASTSSQWLVEIGLMSNKDFKIRVGDMIKLLPEKGFTKVPLTGDFDINKFPDGPIGFITGRGSYQDGSSHIGFIEKRNGELHVIHNNYHTGKVVDQEIKEKFYLPDGKPAYRELNMFIFPRN